jgi:hypothetical protein
MARRKHQPEHAGELPDEIRNARDKARACVSVDPAVCLMCCLAAAEIILRDLTSRCGLPAEVDELDHEGVRARKLTSAELIRNLRRKRALPKRIGVALHAIRVAGNSAEPTWTGDDHPAKEALGRLDDVCDWYAQFGSPRALSTKPPDVSREGTAPRVAVQPEPRKAHNPAQPALTLTEVRSVEALDAAGLDGQPAQDNSPDSKPPVQVMTLERPPHITPTVEPAGSSSAKLRLASTQARRVSLPIALGAYLAPPVFTVVIVSVAIIPEASNVVLGGLIAGLVLAAFGMATARDDSTWGVIGNICLILAAGCAVSAIYAAGDAVIKTIEANLWLASGTLVAWTAVYAVGFRALARRSRRTEQGGTI